MAHNVSPDSTVYVRAASGSGSEAGASSPAASSAASGAAASGSGGGGASVSVLVDQADPSAEYSTRLRSSCRTRRTFFLPLVSVCHTGLSALYTTKLPPL